MHSSCIKKRGVPLVIDLDGTLLQSDLLAESFLGLLKQSFFSVLKVPVWLTSGKAAFKAKIAQIVDLDISVLPFNKEILEWLRQEKATGRKLILSTASNEKYANQVAEYLGIFDEVHASDMYYNLTSTHKRDRCVELYGEHGFDYAGNSMADISVWRASARAIVVHPGPGVLGRAQNVADIQRVFEKSEKQIYACVKALRIHQWLKNFLIFMPLLAGHFFLDSSLLIKAILAFFSFSFCASSVYLLNDMLDLEDDRHHHTKCQRPFASGTLSLSSGVLLVPFLLVVAFLIALILPRPFLVILSAYYLLTLSYALWFKRQVILDVIALAMLYTMRILAGSAALSVDNSFWMLVFSMFIFLSLAVIKRYIELRYLRKNGIIKNVRGRGYRTEDLELLASLGGASGYVAILVLALYINTDHVKALYKLPELLWLACPLLLYWISRAWIIAHRGEMHDDPVVFAMKDKLSLFVIISVIIIFWGAM